MYLLERLKRRRVITTDDSKPKNYVRIHSLIIMGLGGSLGLGIYVLVGQVVLQMTGPAITVSVTIAVLASLFAVLCIAELSSRVPHSGSAYIYSYVIMGEFVAFTVGWSMLLEYMTSTASAARGLSSYLNVLLDDKLSNAFQSILTLNCSFTSTYLDFLSFALILLGSCLLACGAKQSMWLNLVLTIINLITICIIIIAGTTFCIYIFSLSFHSTLFS